MGRLGNTCFNAISHYFTKPLKENSRSYLSDLNRLCHEIIPGDVILIEGNNRMSRIIKQVTQSTWTHAALYIGRLHGIEAHDLRKKVRQHYQGSPGKQLIIESILGNGTIIKPISEYQNFHMRLCRPAGLSHSDTQKVIQYAIEQLGKQYNIRHFMDLGRFLFKSRFLPRRWKSTLFEEKNPKQVTQDICSAMIAKAFQSIQFPILPMIRENQEHKLEMIPRNPKLYIPSDFDYSPYFSIIKYPIFPVSNYGPYHSLPWKHHLLSQDEGVVTNHHQAKNKTAPKSDNDTEPSSS